MEKIMQQKDNLLAYGLSPTFLFTWKGNRRRDEKNYHCHDYIELAFIMSGKGRYKINDIIYEVEEGDIIVLNPGTYHQALVWDGAQPMVEFFIGFSDVRFEGMQPNMLELKQLPVYKAGAELKQRLMRICTMMSSENEDCRVGRYFMMQSYLMQFLIYLLRDQSETQIQGRHYSFESVNKNIIVEQIIMYFEEHYAEKISLDIISENMYVSPFYISKIFKAVTGDTPIHYLINIRLDRAKELIERNPQYSIREIAELVGYDDVFHFSKLFKKRFGVSPSGIKTGNAI